MYVASAAQIEHVLLTHETAILIAHTEAAAAPAACFCNSVSGCGLLHSVTACEYICFCCA